MLDQPLVNAHAAGAGSKATGSAEANYGIGFPASLHFLRGTKK